MENKQTRMDFHAYQEKDRQYTLSHKDATAITWAIHRGLDESSKNLIKALSDGDIFTARINLRQTEMYLDALSKFDNYMARPLPQNIKCIRMFGPGRML